MSSSINPGQLANFSKPAENNKEAILEKLAEHFTDTGSVLEIGSGSGQHAIYFSQNLPHLQWQPTDQGEYFSGLANNLQRVNCTSICVPLYLDVAEDHWPVQRTDYVFTANSLHIMAVFQAEMLIAGAGRILNTGGLLAIYGPFKYAGLFTTESNKNFDQWLKSRDPHSGIRDFESITGWASDAGLVLLHDYAMPANNQLLIFNKI